jgi:hypothetical protein
MISRKLVGKSFGGGIISGLIVCGGLWVFHFIDGPVAAGAAMIDPNKSEKAAAAHPRFLQGTEMELYYPEQFDLLSRLTTDKTALEQYNLGNSSKRQQVVAISVRPLDGGNLNDDSSWRSRSLNTTNYASNKVSIMTKTDNTEKTLFWPHKGRLLIIAISTNDPNDDLPAMINMIKPTIKWRT